MGQQLTLIRTKICTFSTGHDRCFQQAGIHNLTIYLGCQNEKPTAISYNNLCSSLRVAGNKLKLEVVT